MKTILAAIDFSPVSRQVIAEARRLATQFEARLALVHVVRQPIIVPDYPGTFIDTSAIVEEAGKSGRAHLARCCKSLAREGFEVEQHLYVGIPAIEIGALIRRLRPLYVVLGSHGHGMVYELVVGSTAAGILKAAPCPVVVVASPSRPLRRRTRR